MASYYRLYFLPIDFDMNRHPQYPICENFKAADVRGLQRKSRPGLHFILEWGDGLGDVIIRTDGATEWNEFQAHRQYAVLERGVDLVRIDAIRHGVSRSTYSNGLPCAPIQGHRA